MCSEKKKKKKMMSISLPRHVSIIMDGNGRWAKNKGKSRIFGHQAGIKSACNAINFAINHNFSALTLYAFSSENWSRPTEEILALMELFIWVLDNKIKNLHEHNVKLKVIGDTSRFTVKLQDLILNSEHLTCKNDGLVLNIAANYGGRWDIIQGVKQLAIRVKNDILDPDQINEDNLSQVICMNELAPVDLVIRTGGEHRISNFLLWQIAYSELFFIDVLWPDFDNNIFEIILKSFAERERRFGNITSINKSTLEKSNLF